MAYFAYYHSTHSHCFCVAVCLFCRLLACNASNLVNGIASNAGATMVGPNINASFAYCTAAYANNHTSILKIHAMADQAVIYNGTAYLPGAGADTNACEMRNGCQGEAKHQWTHGIAMAQGWQGCNGGTEVQLISLAGVNHQVSCTSNTHVRACVV